MVADVVGEEKLLYEKKKVNERDVVIDSSEQLADL